jgi:hypothetical protein
MKKLARLLILALLFSGYCIAESELPAPNYDIADEKPVETISLSSHEEIVATKNHEEDLAVPYTIDVNYPEISGDNLSIEAKEFNRLVSDLVSKNVQQFKKYVKADMPHMQTLPESVKHNSLLIDYDVDVIKPAKHIILSVRLNIEGMQAGRAHPYHQHQVLTFDLSKNKIITLKDIFKPHANYLNLFAKYANKTLNAKLQDKWMINEGTAPIAKNYQLWNLESDDILITFDEYQVAPYAAGPQEVEIPYSELSAVIAATSPIAPCLKDSKGCEG